MRLNFRRRACSSIAVNVTVGAPHPVGGRIITAASSAAALVGVLFLAACPRADTSSTAKEQQPEAQPNEPAAAIEPSSDATTKSSILDWLDPDAIAAAVGRDTQGLDLAGLASIFALPPRARVLVLASSELDNALLAISTSTATATDLWASDWLAFAPPFGSGAYLVRALTVTPREAQARLTALGFSTTNVDGYPVHESTGAFPWRIVFLDSSVAAFVPRMEIGSGLSPLTAARDLPPSPLAEELRRSMQESGMVLSSYTSGPMLHLDLAADVHQAQITLRSWQGRGLDGSVAFALLSPEVAQASTEQLRDRTLVGESDRVLELAKKVAFTADGPVMNGRLQIPAEDVPRVVR